MPRKQRPSIKRLRRLRRVRLLRIAEQRWLVIQRQRRRQFDMLKKEPDYHLPAPTQNAQDCEAIAWLLDVCKVPADQLARVTTETCHGILAGVLDANVNIVKPVFDLQVKQGVPMLTALVQTIKALG